MRFVRAAAWAFAFVLLLSACSPATLGSLFAPCPQPTAEEGPASQANWEVGEVTAAGPGRESGEVE